jgi:hypothetical protein
VVIAHDPQEAVPERALHDEERVLEVDQVLGRVPLVRELAVCECRKLPGLVGGVGDLEPPILELLPERDEIGRLRRDARVFRRDDGIRRPMPADRLVFIERFPHRLPGHRPVVGRLVVPEIEVPAGLVHRDGVESEAHEASLCPGLVEAVPAGVVRDDGPVLGRPEVVAPGSRGIRPGYHVFLRGVVKVAVAHK